MRALLLLLSGCYFQPTVFERDLAPVSLPPSDDPVGCITLKAGYGRRGRGVYFLDGRRADHLERTLAASPASAATEARARRDHRLALGLWLAGAAIVVGSVAGLVGWLNADNSGEPFVMLAPTALGFALDSASVGVAIRGDDQRRRAIDAFNDAAARENRCPP